MTAPNHNRVYYSKISWSLLSFVVVAFAAPLILMLVQGQWVGLAILLGVSLLPFSIYWRTCYEIRENQLLITCGILYKQKIDIGRIRSLRDSDTMLSSPALSLDRQEIKYNTYDEVFISLKDEDKEQFYATIKQLNPGVQLL
ncbi:PH domain-containing protein [Adhaeribacter rhizoryzae]|uniref:PH domain-containing protein n=1 Tax=Adhaeribacter rhizoryzae TaxID=2607907 RepID=A0A5M6CZF9_9BACT|nr:PH domain-containing protein [Adhaeribacter rhizoryzae]KAA5540601.1 PH domain-containing protein [Adhaeribacter rhizoryzae]